MSWASRPPIGEILVSSPKSSDGFSEVNFWKNMWIDIPSQQISRQQLDSLISEVGEGIH